MIGDRGYNTNIEGNCLARAMYDNVAESPDELAFRKGDVLTVLEQNTAGLEGWWLCSLRGRQGICPGNRLRLLAGVYDTGAGVTSLASITPTTPTASVTSTSRIVNTSGVPGVGVIGVSSPATRMQRPLSKKVVTPKRVGDVFTYDSPRSHSLSNTPTHLQQHPQLDYDVPPTRSLPQDSGRPEVIRLSRSSSVRESYDVPRPVIRSSLEQYDVPRPAQPLSQYDTPKGQRMVSPLNQYDSPKAQFQYDTPKSYQQYDVPRSSAEATRGPRSLIKGVRGGIGGGGGGGGLDGNHEEYDVPRPATGSVHYDVPPSDRSSGVSVMSCESSHLSGSSSNSSLAASESLSLSSLGGSSNRSSLESHDVPVCDFSIENRRTSGSQQMRPKLPPRDPKDTYDVPKAHGDAYDTPPRMLPRGMVLGDGVYDVPPQVSRDVRPSDSVDSSGVLNRFSTGSDSSGELEVTGKDLPLELDSAQDTLTKLQQEAYGAIDKLVALLSSEAWRKKPSLEAKIKDIKVVIFRVRQALLDLLQFAQGSLVNASRMCDPGLVKKISKLLEPLEKAKTVIDDTWASQETGAWNKFLTQETTPEQLTQLALLAPSLSEDVRHLVALIQSNATLIFKRSPTLDSQKQQQEDDDKTPVQERPLPDVPSNKKGAKMGDNLYENDGNSFMEDYDYVNIESKESVEKEHEEIKKEMPDHIRKSFDNLVKQSSQLIVDNDHERAARTAVQNSGGGNNSTSSCIDPNDRQVLRFYGTQAELHMQHLNTAIDAFLLTIENNQPPKVFIAHSKFVILSAHKLVYIGDTVHRNVVNNDVRTRVLNCSNALSDGLKNTVTAVKTAALQFPSVVAVQAMVDAFVAISHLANNLKNATLGAVRS